MMNLKAPPRGNSHRTSHQQDSHRIRSRNLDHGIPSTVAVLSVQHGASRPLTSSKQHLPRRTTLPKEGYVKGPSCPLFVGIGQDVLRRHAEALQRKLHDLRALGGITGIALDIYWGLVEMEGPGQYDWSGYKQLLHSIASMGFKAKVRICFNSTKGVSLPPWVLEVGERNPDIFFTDKEGMHSEECLSLGVDDLPVLFGRTGQEVYQDFMLSFRREFDNLLGTSITSLVIGLGPDGELKYPSHPSDPSLWEYPGHGEFQCYDQSMLATLKACAEHAEPLWGLGGPNDAGQYKEWPQQCGCFTQKGKRRSNYGRFFLQWYSDMLIRHAMCVMGAARAAFEGSPVQLCARIPACQWWSDTDSHAAELTAGYYSTAERNGYFLPFQALSRFGCGLHLGLHGGPEAQESSNHCSNPEKMLLKQRAVAAALHMPVCVETTGLRLDETSLTRLEDAIFKPTVIMGIELPPVQSLVVNSMWNTMLEPDSLRRFSNYVGKASSRFEEVAWYDALKGVDDSITSSQAEISRLEGVKSKAVK